VPRRLHRGGHAAATGIFYVFAFVSDLARSKDSGETLGWKLSADESTWPASPSAAATVIHTDDRHEEARCYAGGMQVEVRVDDVDAEHERLRKLGVAVSDLDDQPWGERTSSSSTPTAIAGRMDRRPVRDR
jgi:uncharacterized glyoxalase superfamily protein PhnB